MLRKPAKGNSGSLFWRRIEIRTQVVPADEALTSALDVEDTLSRDSALLPLGDGVGGNTDASGQLCLGNPLEDPVKGTVVHLANYVHRRLKRVNHQLIEAAAVAPDYKRMVDTPRPGHFGSFADWLEAVRRSRNVSKADVARAGGGSPQAASKWFRGGGVKPPQLRKLADWAGVEYADLRALLDHQPVPKARGRLQDLPKSGDVMRISRKLDQIAWDDEALRTVEALVDHLAQARSAARKRREA